MAGQTKLAINPAHGILLDVSMYVDISYFAIAFYIDISDGTLCLPTVRIGAVDVGPRCPRRLFVLLFAFSSP